MHALTMFIFSFTKQVNFMEMNLKTMRYVTKPGDARPVVFQMNENSPMEPRTL
jgi:hypothetical protein